VLQVLMAAIAKRRMKTSTLNGRSLVALPPKNIEVVSVELADGHRHKYDAWELAGRRIISHHIEQESFMREYSTVLEIILRYDPEHLC
jgi:hypothetical protein